MESRNNFATTFDGIKPRPEQAPSSTFYFKTSADYGHWSEPHLTKKGKKKHGKKRHKKKRLSKKIRELAEELSRLTYEED